MGRGFFYACSNLVFSSQAEILSEIEFTRNGALSDGLAVAFEEELALAEEVDTVDDVQCLADVVIGDEDAHAAMTRITDIAIRMRST